MRQLAKMMETGFGMARSRVITEYGLITSPILLLGIFARTTVTILLSRMTSSVTAMVFCTPKDIEANTKTI